MDRDLQRQLLSMATPLQESTLDLAQHQNQNRNLNQWNDDANGIDLKDYAFKYMGCQNVHTFSDDKAKDSSSDSVFVMNRFVVLRLCPADYCSNYHAMGCQFGYGEYVIAMEDYLNAMARYHYVRYQSFCETCNECMNPHSNASSTNDDYGNNNHQENRFLNNHDDGGNMWSNASATNETDYSYCEYYEVCSNYKDACKYYSSSAEQYEKFFSCTANPYSNKKGYLGPHCRSDGYTIGIGLYTDNQCGELMGDMKVVEQYTGIYFNDSVLELYADKSCISCLDAVGCNNVWCAKAKIDDTHLMPFAFFVLRMSLTCIQTTLMATLFINFAKSYGMEARSATSISKLVTRKHTRCVTRKGYCHPILPKSL